MRLSLSWLEDFVEVPPQADLCRELVAAGIEVDGVEDATAALSHALVCEVRDVAAHPQADSLKVCQIFDGHGTRTVVCGAPDVRASMRAVYLPVGAPYPGGVIARRKIRGIDSDGMLCSRADLGLSGKASGLWALDPAHPVGAKLADVLPPHVVLDLAITPNRPDLLSYQGVAREVGAATQKRLKPGKWRVQEKGGDVRLMARALVDEPLACRRFSARVVANVRVGPSPGWLVERLESIGQRAINNVVDATNYVMHELGQPLHAYDLSRLGLEANLPTLRVRRAQAGERLRTLDDVDRALDPADLVVADAMRPVALAGVMGGLDTWVHSGTTQVVLESACFAPQAVRQTAKRHGLHTEASHRFERGCDPGMTARAVDRCAQLIADLTGGDIAKGTLEVSAKGEAPLEIPLRLERVRQLLGTQLPAETVVLLLDPLGFRCVTRTDAALIFEVPTFRPDVTREVDLVEEVARRYGYNALPERLPNTEGAFAFEPLTVRPQERVRRLLLPMGLTETVHYALTSPESMAPFVATAGAPVTLRNPLGEALSVLRTTLWPSLIATLGHQLRHGQKGVRLFEVGTVLRARPVPAQAKEGQPGPEAGEAPAGAPPAPEPPHAPSAERLAAFDRELPEEALHVACLLHGAAHPGRWYGQEARLGLSDALGTAEALVEAFDLPVPVHTEPAAAPALNPYATAEVWAEAPRGRVSLGLVGRLDPGYAAAMGVPEDVFVLELSLTALQGLGARTVRAEPLPKYPSTRRDVAVVVPNDLPTERLRAFIADHAGCDLGREVVEEVWLFDRYVGKPIADDQVSLAFAISYRSPKETLTDEAVNGAFDGFLSQLAGAFEGLTVRGR